MKRGNNRWGVVESGNTRVERAKENISSQILLPQSPMKWLYHGKITCIRDKQAWLKERSGTVCVADRYIPSDVLINCLRLFLSPWSFTVSLHQNHVSCMWCVLFVQRTFLPYIPLQKHMPILQEINTKEDYG